MPRQHIFNLKFSLKSLEANCHRSSCRVHAILKIQNEERKFNQVAQMKKNTAIFNSDLEWQLVGIDYDEVTGLYGTKNAILSIMYETHETGSRTNKLKVGHVTVNLGNILNEKTYRIHTSYKLEKCYDQAAKIKLAIDLSKIQEDAIRGGGQKLAQDQYTRLKQTMQWRSSKMKQRILDEQKNLLQNKLFEYQDKMEKYRDSHHDQIKRLNQQVERKQQKITLLTQENNSIASALQNLQMTSQKQKSTITNLEQELHQLKEKGRIIEANKDNLSNQLGDTQGQLAQLKFKLEQCEKAKEKKEQYYKAELEKYNKKYLETENIRNRIVFEMEAKLKEELDHKDAYYKQLLEKLEAKLGQQTSHSKQSIFKTTKELIMIKQNMEKVEKDKAHMSLQLEQLTTNKELLEGMKSELEEKVVELQNKLKSAYSENQVSQFSNNNLQKQLNKLKSDKKLLSKANDDLRYELELANKTIDENQQTIVKLSRELKLHKEREYYMEEKFQDQLQMKTYNEECMRGSNNHFRNEIKKLNLKIRLTEEKLEQSEQNVGALTRDRQKLQEQLKKNSNLQFENSQRQIRYESEIKSLKSSVEDSGATCHSLQLQLLEVEKSYENLLNEHKSLENQYQYEITANQQKIRNLEIRIDQQKQQYEFSMMSDLEAKNVMVNAIQNELNKTKQSNKKLQSLINEHGIKLEETQYANRNQADKIRVLQRQNTKIKVQIERHKEEEIRMNSEITKLKREISNLKEELSRKTSQSQGLEKKVKRVRESYSQLVKWILEKIGAASTFNHISSVNVLSASREYIQSIDGQIQMEIVHLVNNGLQKIYNQWDKLQRSLFQTSEQRDRANQECTKLRLEQQYGNSDKYLNSRFEEDKFEQQIQNLTMKLNTKPNNAISIRNDDETLKESLKLEEMKRQNRQLQNQISQKSYDLEMAKQEAETQKRNCHSLKQQIKNLQQEIDDLKSSLSKKNMMLSSYQYQNNDRFEEFSGMYLNKKPQKYQQSFKTDIEQKYRDKKALEDAEGKCQELNRENSLQRAKIQLLENKVKGSEESLTAMEENMRMLQQQISNLDTESKKYQKAYQQQKQSNQQLKNQLEILNAKYIKKEKQMEVEHSEVLQLQKNIDILTQKLGQGENKHLDQLKKVEKQCAVYKEDIKKLEQQISTLKIQKQGLSLEIKSLKQGLTSDKRQYGNKIAALQASSTRSKKQYEELYNKYMDLISQKGQSEEQIKDIIMEKQVLQQNFRKQLAQLTESLQNKQYQLQEIKFTTESKIIQLQRQIEQLTGRS